MVCVLFVCVLGLYIRVFLSVRLCVLQAISCPPCNLTVAYIAAQHSVLGVMLMKPADIIVVVIVVLKINGVVKIAQPHSPFIWFHFNKAITVFW